jgi:hypothetical protein
MARPLQVFHVLVSPGTASVFVCSAREGLNRRWVLMGTEPGSPLKGGTGGARQQRATGEINRVVRLTWKRAASWGKTEGSTDDCRWVLRADPCPSVVKDLHGKNEGVPLDDRRKQALSSSERSSCLPAFLSGFLGWCRRFRGT